MIAPAGGHVRQKLVEALRLDLLGPEKPDEVLAQSPATRYLVGMLAPAGTPVDETEDEAEEVADSDELDAPIPLARTLTPSSIGLSFVVDQATASVEATVSWGEYLPERTEVGKGRHEVWRRIARTADVRIDPSVFDREIDVGDGVSCRWISRRVGDVAVVSFFIVNKRTAPPDRRPPDELWLYQPRISVSTEAGFLPRRLARGQPDPDPDLASSELIYRNRIEFATGHSVATNWRSSSDPTRAEAIWTEILPEREVGLARPGAETAAVLEMDRLAQADSGAAVRDMLLPLAKGYEAWIARTTGLLKDLPIESRDVAADHMRLARESLARIHAGLDAIAATSDVYEAFSFANKALALQRRTVEKVRSLRRGETPQPVVPTWRPFQIAFILQCISGIADPNNSDRATADLLWFPTGGGKTEAYLGLAAFTFAIRRLRSYKNRRSSAGVSVLMRYTLRLLTIQQFQRAAALICACEKIRRSESSHWGSEPFTIGLWVGGDVTPNTFEDSKEVLAKLRAGLRVSGGSPYQLLYCPWCAQDLRVEDYIADADYERTLIKCSNEDCDFNATSQFGLPVLMVDEEIYRNPPSLLLATVDKFAQVAWNGRVQALFGSVERYCPRHGLLTTAEGHPSSHQATKSHSAVSVSSVPPLDRPDLVIQDELHLISGPLGTLTGIYEAVIDELAGAGGVRPKLVASTATIRRAAQQIRALFDRRVAVFPPQGLDAADSYFAVEDLAKRGRLYLGVFAPGKSIKTSLVRVYAAMLSRAQAEFEHGRSAENDSYMTLVGYFNSLRELGGAVRLVDDDVPARIRVLERRGFGPRRIVYQLAELTSRKRSADIAETLKALDRSFVTTRTAGAYPVDVLLASNMLSVGVDIDRLGLMVVSAQPKTSAEYIQATSRVGRVWPGLVIEVYNWVRPRDISHYERFVHYHDTFYRHVEATSVTPFSARARDRALRGVLTGAIRQGIPSMAPEAGADLLDQSNDYAARVASRLAQRAFDVTEREDVRDETRIQISNLLDEWERHTRRRSTRELVYTGRGLKDNSKNVLLRPFEQKFGKGIWPVLTSLREVETEVPVLVDIDPTQ